MTGADRLCDVLLANGIDVCFANPGTSEMHFVAALDRRPEMRCVLGLFEGIVTGAADGYGRMAGRPAATLLHTGPGLANGLANLHNAHRARSPILNVVGDHASYHLPLDPPLASDIESLARPMSDWVGRATSATDVQPKTEAAWLAARTMPGIATLILPADAAWSDAGDRPVLPLALPQRPRVANPRIREIAEALRRHGPRAALLLAGEAVTTGPLDAAGRIASKTGAGLMSEVLLARAERGRGRVAVRRIPYPIDQAVAALRGIDLLVLVGATEPVAFFAYPGKPNRLLPPDCEILTLATPTEDAVDALAALADELGASTSRRLAAAAARDDAAPTGPLTSDAMSVMLAAALPENAIVVEEALTSLRDFFALSTGAPPHDYLMTSGGAIGGGIPVSVGAAIACPGRKVLNLQADGSGMYTLQGLWTEARENLDVLTVILSNRAYATLRHEMTNLGFNDIGRNAHQMMSLDNPPLDWVALARGMGVDGVRVDTCERFADVLVGASRRQGPFLIEAVI